MRSGKGRREPVRGIRVGGELVGRRRTHRCERGILLHGQPPDVALHGGVGSAQRLAFSRSGSGQPGFVAFKYTITGSASMITM